MRSYYVDESKRKEILKNRRKKIQGNGKVLLNIKKSLFFLCICCIFGFMLLAYGVGINDVLTIYIFGLIGCLPALFFFILGLLLGIYIESKYLSQWTIYKSEEIRTSLNGLYYGTYIKFCGSEYRTWDIKFEDVQTLEYDKEKGLFRIKGMCMKKMWTNIRCLVCVSTEKELSQITFNDYFEDFSTFIKEIEECSGKKVIYTNIEN